MRSSVLPPAEFPGYALVDSGGGEKLERFGPLCLRRPDPQALWPRRRSQAEWGAADLAFERDPASGGSRGRWAASSASRPEARGGAPRWTVGWREATFVLRPTPFKHVGLFPEQASNWDWLARSLPRLGRQRPRLLNLFGYTGAASVVALRLGCEVTHVDASKASLGWARENLSASGLPEDAMRLVLDDALAFVRRAARRGERYEAILVDPPHHGRGPKGETWQFEDHAAPLVEGCARLLAERSLLCLSTYAIGFSPLALEGLLAGLGEVEAGELALSEEAALDLAPPRLLPCGSCARVERGLGSA